MAGKWTRMWDADQQRWVEVYLELPTLHTMGRAETTTNSWTQLVDAQGRPIRSAHPIGFRNR